MMFNLNSKDYIAKEILSLLSGGNKALLRQTL